MLIQRERFAITGRDRQQVVAAEQQHGIDSPEVYRSFLLEVGARGAGPFYGLFPLAKEGSSWGWEGDGGDMCSDLRQPLPHRSAWNLDGHPIWDAETKRAPSRACCGAASSR